MILPNIAETPEPPYYAVIFTSCRTGGEDGYAETAARMLALAAEQPGFLGAESVRDAEGMGITVSYWANEDAILRWRDNGEHRVAQDMGRRRWYERFAVRIAKVERCSLFSQITGGSEPKGS